MCWSMYTASSSELLGELQVARQNAENLELSQYLRDFYANWVTEYQTEIDSRIDAMSNEELLEEIVEAKPEEGSDDYHSLLEKVAAERGILAGTTV